jgi:hypothetical protein
MALAESGWLNRKNITAAFTGYRTLQALAQAFELELQTLMIPETRAAANGSFASQIASQRSLRLAF